jgi:uncharacterized protein YijF (DUF1287 family)
MRLQCKIFLLAAGLSCSAVAAEREQELIQAALERTTVSVSYDGSYFSIAYPNGDIPDHLGVCTDLVIRSYRVIGVDLQQLVHEDIKANFKDYPSKRIWGLTRPDKNIDHRRVPNLQQFFKTHGIDLGVSKQAADYRPGDLVTWVLPGNLPHIGIVSDQRNERTGHPLIIHNIGSGPVLEDMLFSYPVTGHYRYLPVNM